MAPQCRRSVFSRFSSTAENLPRRRLAGSLFAAVLAGGALSGVLSAQAGPMPEGPLATVQPAPEVRNAQGAPVLSPSGLPEVPPTLLPPSAFPGARAVTPAGAALPGPGGLITPPFQPDLPTLPAPLVKAASVVLVDARTGTILYEKNARVRRPIASTTKIMTATLLIESGRLDIVGTEDQVTFSQHARATPYANLNAKPGEKFPLRELLYAIMLRSSNDSCVAVAEHLEGKAWRFSNRMTQRARELGALDTNFVTTNGLYDAKHYSTAHDLAVMTRHAIQYPLFNEVASTPERIIQRSINWKDNLIRNHNKFLFKYAGGDGIKTGYVRQSGKCLVASATRPDGGQPWRLITVVLNSPDTYGDSQRLQDWGRKYFQPIAFARKGEPLGVAQVRNGVLPNVPVMAGGDMMAIVRRGTGNDSLEIRSERVVRISGSVEAPVRAEQAAGTVTGLVNGHPVAEVPVVAVSPVPAVWTASLASMFPSSPWWLAVSLLLTAVFLGPRYARAFTKGAFRRRRRLPARSGTTHFAGESRR